MLSYNLQFFAKDGPGGEKTEPATEKKLTDARKDGQVAKSRELANGVMLFALFMILKVGMDYIGNGMLALFENFYNLMPEIVKNYEGFLPFVAVMSSLRRAIVRMLLLMLPVLLIGFVLSFACDFAQVQWKPTAKPLQPKFSKLDPTKGVKKLFSSQSLVELIKSFAKIFLIVYIAYSVLKDQLGVLLLLYDMPLNQAIALLGKLVTDMGIRIAAFYMIIAFADFAYQKIKFSQDMKMTKQEVKDEYKNAEGNPQIKGKIRQKMREVSQRRMMQSLPEADVVITNPTHYAVAIKYDPDKFEAPIVLAKGEDHLALRIKEKAKECKIEIVENKPLARMLYANVEVGEAVPPELYQAVAEVLAMVYHMQGKV